MHSCTIPEASNDRPAELARLRLLARKVALVHGGHQPRVVELAALVTRIADAPAQPIAADDVVVLGRLTDDFTPWPEACGSVRALYAGLHALRS